MKTETITATGKHVSLTPNSDKIVLNPEAPKLSVEYAKARNAINEDFKANMRHNQALAKRLRRESKKAIVEHLKGKVSTKEEQKLDKDKKPVVAEDGAPVMEKKYLVTFPDHSVARL